MLREQERGKRSSPADAENLNEATLKRAADGMLKPELVVDGRTLVHILHHKEVEHSFADLSSMCGSVVVCRASPAQKAAIVEMMRTYELRTVVDKAKTPGGRFHAR